MFLPRLFGVFSSLPALNFFPVLDRYNGGLLYPSPELFERFRSFLSARSLACRVCWNVVICLYGLELSRRRRSSASICRNLSFICSGSEQRVTPPTSFLHGLSYPSPISALRLGVMLPTLSNMPSSDEVSSCPYCTSLKGLSSLT